MPDKKIFDMSDLENFELPPLPSRPLKIGETQDEPAPAPAPEPVAERAPLPDIDAPASAIYTAPGSEAFNSTVETAPAYEAAPEYEAAEPAYEANAYETAEAAPEYEAAEPAYEAAPAYETAEPVYEAPAYEAAEPVYEAPAYEAAEPAPEPITEPIPEPIPEPAPAKKSILDFDPLKDLPPITMTPPKKDPAPAAAPAPDPDEKLVPDYDVTGGLEQIDPNSIVLQEMTKAKPGRKNDDEEEMIAANAPVLDDLSDQYTDPEKKIDSLMDQDKLDSDEKLILKQRLMADLSRRPGGFNAAVSKRLEDRLMEEQQLKVAKKGFGVSIIPILLGIISGAICFFTIDWGNYDWLHYIGAVQVIAALVLFIKSVHSKMLSTILYALLAVLYIVFGGVLYILDPVMQSDPGFSMHITTTIISVLCNVLAIIILAKSESVNVYYTKTFSKH